MAGLKLVFRHARADGSQSYVTVFHSKVEMKFFRIYDKTWTDSKQLMDSREYSMRQRSIDKRRDWQAPLKKGELAKVKKEKMK